jgi:hypothetical protein
MTLYPFLVLEAGSVPLGPNFLQLDIGEPSSGFTLGLRSVLGALVFFTVFSSLVFFFACKKTSMDDYDGI